MLGWVNSTVKLFYVYRDVEPLKAKVKDMQDRSDKATRELK